MSIQIIVGDDDYKINQHIEALKQTIDPAWQSVNFQVFAVDDLASAIAAAQSISFNGSRVIVVKDCGNFSQLSESDWNELQKLDQIPSNHQLAFVGKSIDRRLKVVKHLFKYGTLTECSLIPPWRTDLIVKAISAQAKAIRLKLSADVVEYLAEAVGNDQMRSHSELVKLKIYANGNPLTRADVETLVPCTRQTSLQLATAIRTGDIEDAINLLEPLISQVDHPLIIIATLITQMRTWLWVKSAVMSGIHQNANIAQVCEIGNPNRVFFLRQEVAPISIAALSKAMFLLIEIEHRLKQGRLRPTTAELMPEMIQIVSIFQH